MERPAEQSLVPSAAGNKQPLSFFGGALSLSGQLGAPLGQLFSGLDCLALVSPILSASCVSSFLGEVTLI